MQDFSQLEYKDLCEGVIFKIKDLNPIDLLNLVMANIDPNTRQLKYQKEFLSECMQQFLWTKDGLNWYPLLDSENRPRLPELNTNRSLILDLMFVFRKDVLMPVFTESKTFHVPTEADTKKTKKGS